MMSSRPADFIGRGNRVSPKQAGALIAGNVLLVLAPWAPLLLLLGAIVLIVGLAMKGLSSNKRLAAVAVGALVLALGVIPMLAPSVGPAAGPGPTAGIPHFTVIMQGTRSTARDVQAELFDTQGGTGGGGETPTATLCAYGTNAELDIGNRILRHAITVDDDVATSTATFSAPDSCSVDFSFKLDNPTDDNGDGVMDSKAVYFRLRSAGVTVTEDGNGSSTRRNIFMRDNTFGWYIGASLDVDTINTDGQWVSVAPAGTQDSELQAAHDWNLLGFNAGADEDYASFAYISRNYGFFGFTQPTAGYIYTQIWDVGVPTDFTTITIIVFLSARA